MIITLYDNIIPTRHLDAVVKILENDSLAVVPTDTLYAFVCDINSNKAAHKLAALKGKKLEKSNFSIICSDLSMASQYVKPLSNQQFAFIKGLNTGGFTFVLKASSLTPKIFQNKKRTIGIRISQNAVVTSIINRLNRPLLVTSVPRDDDGEKIYKNAELIYEKYSSQVGIVIDAGEVPGIPSTVLDMTEGNNYDIIRMGAGIID